MTVKVGVIKDDVELDSTLKALARQAAGKGCGALVMFMGFVKGVVEGSAVRELVYEAHESYALRKLREIGEWAVKEFGVEDVVILHRVGALRPGDPTIYVIVTAVTRSKAFEAAAQVLERVKHEAPIYKLEVREDGEYWVLGDGKRLRRGNVEGGGAEA